MKNKTENKYECPECSSKSALIVDEHKVNLNNLNMPHYSGSLYAVNEANDIILSHMYCEKCGTVYHFVEKI